MCCFSRPVKHVAGTKIFARDLGEAGQALVYSMNVEIDEELAMVLPLPVPPSPAEDAVQFVSLAAYPTFFADLQRSFPEMFLAAQAKGGLLARGGPPAPKLVVHDVGDFEASFVPTQADFARLDERFRLPADAWNALPDYRDWGFAVFRLKPKKGWLGGLKKQTVHPMAFTFPRRDRRALFFPTVHIHDGHVSKRASFDHQLYLQGSPIVDALLGWTHARGALGDTVDVDRAAGLVDGARGGHTHTLFGELANTDTWVHEPEGVTEADLRGRGESFEWRLKAGYAFDDYASYPDERVRAWADTATRKLPALARALREGLPALVQAKREAWKLGPLTDDLAPYWMNGPNLWHGTSWMDQDGPGTPGGPGKVALTIFTDRVERQDVTLAFRALPDNDALAAICASVKALFDGI